jgi:biotin carboxyl carrier protein
MTEVRSPLHAQLVQWLVMPGMLVAEGSVLGVLEAMKMEHELRAPCTGRVGDLLRQTGDLVTEGELLLNIEQTIQSGQGLEKCIGSTILA